MPATPRPVPPLLCPGGGESATTCLGGGRCCPDGIRRFLDRRKGLIACCCVSAMNASLFILRSGPLAAPACSTVILGWSEVVS